MQRPFRFGVVSGGTESRADWVALARRAEALGYSSLLMPDRPSLGSFAPFTAMAIAAQATTTLRVGSHVFCNDYRHPALLARETATLDILSDGRCELGLGAGVSAEDYRQLGLPFDDAGTRVGRLEEALQIIKQAFTQEMVNFSGKYYTVTEMKGSPRPVQKPHPPIIIGSGGRRMLSIAGRLADCIAPTPKFTAQGPDPNDVPLEEKVAWVRKAAGARFEQLELCQTVFYIAITGGAEINRLPGAPMPQRPMSIDQAVEHLEGLRQRYGFSYIQIFQGQVENFAPVVARLAGK
jgi:probable F420-dependent oxidoreductase